MKLAHDAPTMRTQSVAGRPMVVCIGAEEDGQPTIAFYDESHPRDGLPGQLASHYYYATLAGTGGYSRGLRQQGQPLTLHGGIPEWNMSGEAMDEVMAWARSVLGPPPVTLRVVDDLPF